MSTTLRYLSWAATEQLLRHRVVAIMLARAKIKSGCDREAWHASACVKSGQFGEAWLVTVRLRALRGRDKVAIETSE